MLTGTKIIEIFKEILQRMKNQSNAMKIEKAKYYKMNKNIAISIAMSIRKTKVLQHLLNCSKVLQCFLYRSKIIAIFCKNFRTILVFLIGKKFNIGFALNEGYFIWENHLF